MHICEAEFSKLMRSALENFEKLSELWNYTSQFSTMHMAVALLYIFLFGSLLFSFYSQTP
jgi:hypothetical protein